MCQQRKSGDITRCIYSGNIGSHFFIYFDAGTCHFYVQIFETETFGNRSAANAYQYFIAFNGFSFSLFFKYYFITVNLNNFGIEVEFNPFFGINITQHGRDFEIQPTQNFGQHFHNCNFYSQTIIETGKFHSYHSTANNNQ